MVPGWFCLPLAGTIMEQVGQGVGGQRDPVGVSAIASSSSQPSLCPYFLPVGPQLKCFGFP